MSSRPKPRILFVIAAYSPIVGGAERQAQKQAEMLVNRGYQVSVLTQKRLNLHRYQEISGVKVYRAGILNHKIRQYSFYFSVYWFIKRNRFNFELVHIHQGLVPAAIASKTAFTVGLPSIVKIGNSGYKFDFSVMRKKFVLGNYFCRMVKRYASAFVAITPDIRQRLEDESIARDRIINIPNGVDLYETSQRFDNLHKIQSASSQVVGLCVARLNEAKNHFFLLKIIELLKNKCFKLLIFGDGELRADLERKVRAKGLDNKVSFLGNVTNVHDFFEIADFYISPSRTEGLSNSLLEAMSFGVVPLVSDIPGNRAVIPACGCGGYLLPLDDLNCWVNAVSKIIDDPLERNSQGAEAREIIENNFSIGSVVDEYEKLYVKLVGTCEE